MRPLHSVPTTGAPRPGADAGSFEDFVRPHWTVMAGLAKRSCPAEWEDALQEAVTAAWRKRGQFDPERGTARNWLLAIVADQSYKHRRRRQPVLTAVPDEAQAPVDPSLGLDLEAAIAALSQRQRLAVNLRYYLGLPIADLAQVMDCSEGTVKSTLSDARRRLRTQLGEDYR